MHQTTLRFAPDLWAALDEEAKRLGISTAQYIREAALARLSYGLGRRDDRGLEEALMRAGSTAAEAEWGPEEPAHTSEEERVHRREVAVEHSHDVLSSSEALWAQGKLARERARELLLQRHDRLNREAERRSE